MSLPPNISLSEYTSDYYNDNDNNHLDHNENEELDDDDDDDDDSEENESPNYDEVDNYPDDDKEALIKHSDEDEIEYLSDDEPPEYQHKADMDVIDTDPSLINNIADPNELPEGPEDKEWVEYNDNNSQRADDLDAEYSPGVDLNYYENHYSDDDEYLETFATPINYQLCVPTINKLYSTSTPKSFTHKNKHNNTKNKNKNKNNNHNNNKHLGQRKGRGAQVQDLVGYAWQEYIEDWEWNPEQNFYETKVHKDVLQKCMYLNN